MSFEMTAAKEVVCAILAPTLIIGNAMLSQIIIIVKKEQST